MIKNSELGFDIRFVQPEDILRIRQRVLRPNGKLEDCQFPKDYDERGFHLGLYTGEVLISIASFHPEEVPFKIPEKYLSTAFPWASSQKEGNKTEETLVAFRLRGMATDNPYAGQGWGAKLLREAERYLLAKNCHLLWFNARRVAYPFYSRLGYQFAGDAFDIPGIGEHKQMFKFLK